MKTTIDPAQIGPGGNHFRLRIAAYTREGGWTRRPLLVYQSRAEDRHVDMTASTSIIEHGPEMIFLQCSIVRDPGDSPHESHQMNVIVSTGSTIHLGNSST